MKSKDNVRESFLRELSLSGQTIFPKTQNGSQANQVKRKVKEVTSQKKVKSNNIFSLTHKK
jgi:hypothetical protein